MPGQPPPRGYRGPSGGRYGADWPRRCRDRIAAEHVRREGTQLRGTFRFHEEFAWAVDFITQRRIDVRPVLSRVLPLSEARRAFDLASDRKQSMKVQVSF